MKFLHVCRSLAFPLSACLYHGCQHHGCLWWSALTDSLLLCQVLAHITAPPSLLPQLSEVETASPCSPGIWAGGRDHCRHHLFLSIGQVQMWKTEQSPVEVFFQKFHFLKTHKSGWGDVSVSSTNAHGHFWPPARARCPRCSFIVTWPTANACSLVQADSSQWAPQKAYHGVWQFT